MRKEEVKGVPWSAWSALECKGVPGVTGKFGLGVQNEAGQVVVVVKTLPANAGSLRRTKRCWFDPWVGKIPWRRKWQPILVFLPGKPHDQRSLVGYSPWGVIKSQT